MKKIKSFTIVELLVVLIISSLLVFFSLSILINFNSYFKKTLKEQALGNDVLWFEKRFKEDIIKADYITGNSEIIRMHNEGRFKSYELYDNKILIRTPDYTDTLNIEVNSCELEYISTNIIKYIEISFTYQEHSFAISQNKEYNAKYLFEIWRKQ